jgi:hypothetical protein
MWNRTRDWAARLYPIVLLLALGWVWGGISHRAFELSHNNYGIQQWEQQLGTYQEEVPRSQFTTASRRLRGATASAHEASQRTYWLLMSALIGYLFLARESFHFRLAMTGLVALAISMQALFYPIS